MAANLSTLRFLRKTEGHHFFQKDILTLDVESEFKKPTS